MTLKIFTSFFITVNLAGRCAAFSTPYYHHQHFHTTINTNTNTNNGMGNANAITNIGRSSSIRSRSRSSISKTRRRSQTATATSLNLQMEDIIYNAQSTASSMASSSLSSFTDQLGGGTGAGASIASLVILYFAGLLTSFSPCSLGLLPLTMSYISSAAGDRDDKAVLLPTIAFATGLAAVFCGLGLSASLLGGLFGGGAAAADDLWGAFLLASLSSGVSIAMGLQLLELVNIPLPSLELNLGAAGGMGTAAGKDGSSSSNGEICIACSEIQFDEEGNVIQGKTPSSDAAALDASSSGGGGGGSIGSLFRTFLLGGSSALVASPCATPVLTSILAFVAASQDPALGAVLLLVYTLGYSTPLLFVAATGGQALVNLQEGGNGGSGDGREKGFAEKIGEWVNPLTASVLIWYGVNGFLVALFGDPSLAGLAPILE